MSGEDVLARASRTLRAQAREPSADAARTRALVLMSASRSVRRRKLALTLVPVAAVFAISTAWASSHRELPQVCDRVLHLLVSTSGETRKRMNLRSAPTVVPPTATDATAATPLGVPEAIAPSPPELSVDALPQASRRSLRRPDASARAGLPAGPEAAEAVAPSAASDTDEGGRLYADAHRAHFVDGDPASALRAWDAYLAAAPEGPFVPEARYNRALTLVRLGRMDEARRALEPFAEGVYDGYRAKEATALLHAMSQRRQ
jgi:hypothetical protein